MKVFLLLSCFAVSALCVPSTSYAIHERRDGSPISKWIQRDMKVNPEFIFPISIALAQQNLENGYEFLMDVSHPDSPNYGKHWTADKVANTFSAAETTISSVKSWLQQHGISEDRITLSKGRNWLRMNLTVSETEYLLKTEYKVYEHKETGKRSLACEEYSVSAHVQRHIDFITPTIQSLTLTKIKPRADTVDSGPITNHHPRFRNATNFGSPSRPGSLNPRDSGYSSYGWDLSVCAGATTRACMQALYNIPNGTLSLSSYAVVEYFQQAFIEYDLELYIWNLVSDINFDQEPAIYVMEDASFQTTTENYYDDLEGNLDVQVGLGLIYPAPLWYYQISSDDVFFDALDASYCTVDAASPDCGTTPLASVISVSYGSTESPGDATQTRQCNEYMKLGLLGTTIIYSSGDAGVGSSCTQFQIDFPANCPYVTAVGATQIPSGGSGTSQEVAAASFGSGGGFSNYWAMPSYQSSAISTYYKSYAPTYTAAQYNNSKAVRGYPDISANGVNVFVVFQYNFGMVDGTSASAPTIGGVISLINEQRKNVGKSTVGFINPVLYANPSALNDITSGTNPGCNTNGFSAVPGWDPVTGLGTPNYQKLLEVWLALA